MVARRLPTGLWTEFYIAKYFIIVSIWHIFRWGFVFLSFHLNLFLLLLYGQSRFPSIPVISVSDSLCVYALVLFVSLSHTSCWWPCFPCLLPVLLWRTVLCVSSASSHSFYLFVNYIHLCPSPSCFSLPVSLCVCIKTRVSSLSLSSRLVMFLWVYLVNFFRDTSLCFDYHFLYTFALHIFPICICH